MNDRTTKKRDTTTSSTLLKGPKCFEVECAHENHSLVRHVGSCCYPRVTETALVCLCIAFMLYNLAVCCGLCIQLAGPESRNWASCAPAAYRQATASFGRSQSPPNKSFRPRNNTNGLTQLGSRDRTGGFLLNSASQQMAHYSSCFSTSASWNLFPPPPLGLARTANTVGFT